MGPRPSPHHSIERIDNDGNYEPGNCRWATRAEQNRNRSDNVFLEFDGQRKTVTEWSRTVGIGVKTLELRIKTGWTVEQALSRPVEPRTWKDRPHVKTGARVSWERRKHPELPVHEDIGKRIVEHRRLKNMSQQDLYIAADLNQGFLSAIENGHKMPGMSAIRRLSRALGLPLKWFFIEGEEGDERIQNEIRKAEDIARLKALEPPHDPLPRVKPDLAAAILSLISLGRSEEQVAASLGCSLGEVRACGVGQRL